MDFERDRREEEIRRAAGRDRPTEPSVDVDGRAVDDVRVDSARVESGASRVERVSEDTTRRAARRGTREALDEKEQEESGGGGLYGS